MADPFLVYIIIFILSLIQSIIGVGLLVVGTPVFLMIGYNMIEVMSFLLPISIITSSISLLTLKFKIRDIKLDKKNLQYFFTICLLSMLAGLVILKNFSYIFNFKILVATIIIISIFIKINTNLKNIKVNSNKFYKKIIIFFIGFAHGLTNSGGTLLSLFLINNEKKNVFQSIYNIHFFYFILALSQLIILISLINKNDLIFLENLIAYTIPLLSCIIGTVLISKLNIFLNYLVYILALIAAISLILN